MYDSSLSNGKLVVCPFDLMNFIKPKGCKFVHLRPEPIPLNKIKQILLTHK